MLEFLFDVMSESYTLPSTDFDKENVDPKDRVLNLQFFFEKLFSKEEQKEVHEVDKTLASIKAALVYKGLDFSIIFAEEEELKKEPKRSTKKMTREER